MCGLAIERDFRGACLPGRHPESSSSPRILANEDEGGAEALNMEKLCSPPRCPWYTTAPTTTRETSKYKTLGWELLLKNHHRHKTRPTRSTAKVVPSHLWIVMPATPASAVVQNTQPAIGVNGVITAAKHSVHQPVREASACQRPWRRCRCRRRPESAPR